MTRKSDSPRLLPDLPDTLEECHARIRRLEALCRVAPHYGQQVEVSWPRDSDPRFWPLPKIVVTVAAVQGAGATPADVELHLAQTVGDLVQMHLDNFYDRVQLHQAGEE